MIEFGEGPTHEQVHELFQETTVLLTMLTRPGVHDSDQARQQTEQTYTLSPPYALVVLASIGAGRFWRLTGNRKAGETRPAAPFPRDILQTVPADGRPDLLFLTIDLVEAIASGGRVRPLVDQLLVDGVRAYRVLLSVVHELGWLAARADETIKNVVELVTVEALTAEQDWYASQDGR